MQTKRLVATVTPIYWIPLPERNFFSYLLPAFWSPAKSYLPSKSLLASGPLCDPQGETSITNQLTSLVPESMVSQRSILKNSHLKRFGKSLFSRTGSDSGFLGGNTLFPFWLASFCLCFCLSSSSSNFQGCTLDFGPDPTALGNCLVCRSVSTSFQETVLLESLQSNLTTDYLKVLIKSILLVLQLN